MPGTMNYPYRKGVDIPAWVLQFIVCLVFIGLSATALAVVHTVDNSLDDGFGYDDDSWNDYNHKHKRSWDDPVDVALTLLDTVAGVAIGISALTIIFNIVEIVLIARKRMPPALYLSSTCIKTAIWIAVFIVEVIALGIPGIALSAVMFITSSIQMGFGAHIVHKKRKGAYSGGKYEPALNPTLPNQQGTTPYGLPPPSQPYGAPAPQVYGTQQVSPQQPYGMQQTQPQPYGVAVNNPYAPPQQGTAEQKPHEYTYTSHVQTFPSPIQQSPQPTPSPQPQHQGYPVPMQTPPPGQQQVYPAPTPQYGYGPNSYDTANRH